MLVHTGSQCTMTSPTTSEQVRFTITTTPEVHATFQRLAKANGHSLSRAVGDWLGDTIEAAEFMAQKVEEARAAPRKVMAELQAFSLGMADELGGAMDRMRSDKAAAVAGRAAGGASSRRAPGSPSRPPSSNTGGKVPSKHGGKS